MPSLLILLILLFGAVFGVMFFKILRLPSILGYLVVGMILGPHAFNSLEDTAVLHRIGEFGIVFLMFSIGLEFSLPQLKKTSPKIVISAIAQIVVSMLLAIPTVYLISIYFKDSLIISWQAYLVFASVFAMSSTAIVSKVLIEKLQLHSEHGKLIIHILLFQDLVIIPFLVLIPSLQNTFDSIWYMVGLIFLKIILLLSLVLKAGEPILKKWMDIVAKKQSTELFMLNILLITIAMASLTEYLELSMPLGAFLAGLIISETHYKIQVEEDIKPFKELLLGLFFITIGSTLNFNNLLHSWGLVLFLIFIIVVAKSLILFFTFRIINKNNSLSIKSALGLAHAGEFGFLIIQQSSSEWFGSLAISQSLTVAIVISMLIAPFLLQYSNVIALKFTRQEWLLQSLNITHLATQKMGLSKHIVIAGFGHIGQSLADNFIENKLPYIAIDFHPDIVDTAKSKYKIIYGDASRKESLSLLSLNKATILVLTHNNIESYIKIFHFCKEIAPNIKIIMRVNNIDKKLQLQKQGFENIICDSEESIKLLHDLLKN